MKRIVAKIKKIDGKLFLFDILPTQDEDFGVIDPFENLPYELQSELEVKQLIVARLNSVDYKMNDDKIDIIYCD